MRTFEVITSRQNPKVLEAASLCRTKDRKETGLFFFEGKKLLEEAVNRKVPLSALFVREDVEPDRSLLEKIGTDCRLYKVTGSVYEKISAEKSPEGIFCIAKALDKFHKFATIYYKREFFQEQARTLLFCVSIRDPGNLGSIIRSAAAFGCEGLILSEDCADVDHPKTIRASMGTVFDFPIVTVKDAEKSVAALKDEGRCVYAAALRRDAMRTVDIDPKQRCVFLIGNEGHGLPPELIEQCDGAVFIPMSEKAESLNASVAASVLLYERYVRN